MYPSSDASSSTCVNLWSMIVWLNVKLIAWLIDWLIHWSIDWLIDFAYVSTQKTKTVRRHLKLCVTPAKKQSKRSTNAHLPIFKIKWHVTFFLSACLPSSYILDCALSVTQHGPRAHFCVCRLILCPLMISIYTANAQSASNARLHFIRKLLYYFKMDRYIQYFVCFHFLRIYWRRN